jgi:hypothetical protein
MGTKLNFLLNSELSYKGVLKTILFKEHSVVPTARYDIERASISFCKTPCFFLDHETFT